MSGFNNKPPNQSINRNVASNSNNNGHGDDDDEYQESSRRDKSQANSSCSSPKSTPSKSSKKANTEDPSSSSTDLVFDTKALLVMLECPSCHVVPVAPPIYMCVDGHNICGDCRSISPNFKCPQCKQAVTDARNFLAEGLLDKLKIKCPNAKDGCTELILIQDEKIHLVLCHYRSIVCNQKQEKDCFNVLTCYTNYIKHLKKVHKINGTKENKLHVVQQGLSLLTNLDIPMASEAWPINFLEVYGKTFLTGTEIAEDKIFWWISLFGPPDEAEKYIGKITLFNKNLDVEVSYSGPVNDFRRAPAIILEEGTGLILSNNSFRQFTFIRMCDVGDPLENNMRWNVVFNVFQRKQPYGVQFNMGDFTSTSNSTHSRRHEDGKSSSNKPVVAYPKF